MNSTAHDENRAPVLQPSVSTENPIGEDESNRWPLRAFMGGAAAITLVWVVFMVWLVTKVAHATHII